MILLENYTRIALKTVLIRKGYRDKVVSEITDEVIKLSNEYRRITDEAIAHVEEGNSKIRRALDRAGYTHVDDTEENLIQCFMDYVDSGIWQDLTMDDIEGITLDEMCQALLKLNS